MDTSKLKSSTQVLCEQTLHYISLLRLAENCLLNISSKVENSKSVEFEESLWDIKSVCNDYWTYKKQVLLKRELERTKE